MRATQEFVANLAPFGLRGARDLKIDPEDLRLSLNPDDQVIFTCAADALPAKLVRALRSQLLQTQ